MYNRNNLFIVVAILVAMGVAIEFLIMNSDLPDIWKWFLLK